MRRFLNAVKPKAVVLVELEMWPNFVRNCKKRGIPIAVINGRMTAKSLFGYKLLKPLLRPLWQTISWFGVQDEIQKERFICAGAPVSNIKVIGSVKFDKTPPEGWEDAKTELGFSDGSLVVVAGSTHRGEERIVLDAWKKVKEEIPALKLLLCPRHLERLGEVETLLNESNCKWSRKTDECEADIVLLDAPELPCPKDEMLYRFMAFFLLKISKVKTVFVDGKKVLEDGRLVSTSQDEILMETSRVYRELFEDLMK